MGFFNFFKPKAKPQNVLQQVQELSAVLIVGGFRRVFAAVEAGPSPQMSDALIMQIYSRICTAFREASEKRGERIPADNMNMIVLHFLEVYRISTPEFFESHIDYELQKYSADGLRPSFQQPLKLINANDPEQQPAALSVPSSNVISNEDVALRAYMILEERKKNGVPGDEISAWVQAERELKAEAKDRLQLMNEPEIPAGLGIVGTVGSDGKNANIHIFPGLDPDNHAKVTVHESLHLLALKANMPPFEDLALMIKTSGDETKTFEYPYADQFYIREHFPLRTTRILVNASGMLGLVPTNPIPVETIYHEFRYFSELRYQDGSAVVAKRVGCVLSPVSKYPVDCWSVSTADRQSEIHMYIAPYCKVTSDFAPDGFEHRSDYTDSKKHYDNSLGKLYALQDRLLSVLMSGPDSTQKQESIHKERESLVMKLVLVLGEYRLEDNHSTQLSNIVLESLTNLSPWHTLSDLKLALRSGDDDEIQKNYRFLASKKIPVNLPHKEEFNKQIARCKKLHPEKFCFRQLFKMFK
ncbi:MAG: hypothetical protein NTV93_21115 [Verrucomicrobia bacterium]|nr:hypothetical protein [Verrucomicrobiota bacterium]